MIKDDLDPARGCVNAIVLGLALWFLGYLIVEALT